VTVQQASNSPGRKAPVDFLTAMGLLAPTGGAVMAIAAFFGFDAHTQHSSESPSPPVSPRPQSSVSPVRASPARAETAELARRPLHSRLLALQPEPTTASESPPTWLASPEPASQPVKHAYSVSIIPLFRENLTRALLIGAAAQERSIGEIDIPALVREISCGTLPRAAPRRSVRTLGRRVQMLVDAGRGMEAFTTDIKGLVKETLRFVGYNRLQVRWFHGNPARGIFASDGAEVERCQIPGPGETLLIVSDLGIGAYASAGGATSAEWLAFVDAARTHRCLITAIVPYPLRRIPVELRTRMRILCWDRTTGVRDLLRGRVRADVASSLPASNAETVERLNTAAVSLAVRASLAARAEPQLLRKLRLEIEPMLDVGAEADLYWSSLIDVHGSAGIVLQREALDDLRQRLSSSPSLLDEAWNATKELHQQGPRALLNEEELTYLTLRGLDDPARLARAQAILAQLVGLLHAGRLGLWGERAILRFPRKLFDGSDRAVMLGVGVARSSGNALIWARLPSGVSRVAYPWLTSGAGQIGQMHVGLVEGGIVFSASPFALSHEINVPSMNPFEIELSWQDGDQSHRETIRLDRNRRTTYEAVSDSFEIHSFGAASYRIVSSEDVSDQVVIFMSYAHDDDLIVSTDQDELGFVSFLDQNLRLKLRDLGARQANVWRDRRRVSQGDEFADIIDDGLKRAELLVVVMSQNWMRSPYCRKEFEVFLSLRRAAGVTNPAARILVVGKGYVDRSVRPPELQRQEGFLFYSRDDENDLSAITPFFNRGKVNDRFYAELDDLASELLQRVTRILSGAPAPEATQRTGPIASPNGRTIYLAKPASDMRAAYSRLAFELQGKGFIVAPDPATEVPSDNSAKGFITDALTKSEVFVHLVGDRGGFAPEGLDNIVKLQLALARAEAAQVESWRGQMLTRRIVWAPKILDEGGSAVAGSAVERDPLRVLESFDQQIATDMIDGGILSNFVEFLFEYLTEATPRIAPTPSAKNQMEVYLACHPSDEDFAGAIANALRESAVKIRIPAAGLDPETRRYNYDLLMKCDAVAVCWGNASEVWVRSEADRLRDLETLGRTEQFAFRGLIAGPPPASHKKKNTLSLIFQDGEFDRVIDLVEKGPPTAQLLVDLISTSRVKP
jgi:hypothetical protein